MLRIIYDTDEVKEKVLISCVGIIVERFFFSALYMETTTNLHPSVQSLVGVQGVCSVAKFKGISRVVLLREGRED